MADQKLTALPPVVTPAASDSLYVVPTVGGASQKMALSQVGSYLGITGGNPATAISLGATPAAAGVIRLPNGGEIVARNAANTADLRIAVVDSSNDLTIGSVSHPGGTYIQSGLAVSLFRGANFLQFTGTIFQPSPDATVRFGTAANRWSEGHLSSLVAIGTNPAQSGAVRLANSQAIVARNAANTADLPLVKTATDNTVAVGDPTAAATYVLGNSVQLIAGAHNVRVSSAGAVHASADGTVQLGTTGMRFSASFLSQFETIGDNPAQSGALRFANTAVIRGRNAANTADIDVLDISAQNDVRLGPQAGGTYPANLSFGCALTGVQTFLFGGIPKWFSTQTYVGSYTDKATNLGQAANNRFGLAHIGTAVAVGDNPAQSGALRLPNIGEITVRNSTNTGDLKVFQGWTDNKIYIGSVDPNPDSGVVLRSGVSVAVTFAPLVIAATSYQQFAERTAPGAAPANSVNLWAEDNGSGKTRLMCQFATGAAVQIAIEP